MNWQYDWTTFGPRLVIRGALLGSLFIGFLGYNLAAKVVLPTRAEAPTPTVVELPSPPLEETTADQIPESPSETFAAESDCKISVKYPKSIRRWCEEITRVAEKYHLPPDLIAAVIWIESGGDPQAYSHSGAVGLMQVMPRDGLARNFQCANGPCFANRPTTEQLQDPSFNLQYGARMLASLIKKHGNFRDALRAYGPMDAGYSYADKVLSIYQKYGQDSP
jgi:soluble lytic murein transglycosylase-like protein